MKNILVTLVALATLTSVQADEDPLEPLNRRIGTWANTTYQKKAAWTPKERTTTGEETIKWILDKKFIQIDVTNADDTKGRSLITYDSEAKVYRSWFFGNQNEFPRGDSIGRWDPKTDRRVLSRDAMKKSSPWLKLPKALITSMASSFILWRIL